MTQILKSLLLLNIIMFFTACHSTKDFMHTVAKVDIQKYMGTWYVIETRPTFLEKDAYNSIEKYTWNEKKNQIDIDFTYTKGSLTGPLKRIDPKVYLDYGTDPNNII